jgi:hypothetical protein
VKGLRFGWILFLVIGLPFLAIGLAGLYAQTSFDLRAVQSTGKVVQLAEGTRIGGRRTYSPVVSFQTPAGKAVKFRASYSEPRPTHHVGEVVEVMYLPENPRRAQIKGFTEGWLGVLVTCTFGLVFTGIGAGVPLYGWLARRRKNYLLSHGDEIRTEYQSVERNPWFTVNGKRPWRIVSHWLDPAANKLHVYYSENLWFDPTNFVKSPQISVLRDPGNPRRYHMDVSFLPELDE